MIALRQTLLLCLLLCAVRPVWADSLEDRLNTVWESLWQQAGSPTQLVRWEQDIKFRVIGVNLSLHRDHAIKAMNAVAEAAGIKAVDISELAEAESQANLTMQVVSDGELPDNEPCVTQSRWRAWKLEKVTIKMRSSSAWRCNLHETMHAMGIRGHPSGQTVLSYFPWRRDVLMDMDKLMLKAWYSSAMRVGMTPFEALAVLADEVVASTADAQPQALEVKQRFLAQTMNQMKAYARGTGELPSILLRSGKTGGAAIQTGAVEMAYFVGLAHAKGVTVAVDHAEAVTWFALSAKQKHVPSQLLLAAAHELGEGRERDLSEAYKWFSLADVLRPGAGKAGMDRLAAKLTPDQLEDAKRQAADFK
jgi:hypothetical protein